MKALSIQQPWAWLIVHGYKPVENRTWATNYRGPLLIHASSAMKEVDYDHCLIFTLRVTEGQVQLPRREAFAFGAEDGCGMGGIVGSANLTHCTLVNLPDRESPFFVGPHGFWFIEPKILPFQPRRGQLGIFST